MNHPRWRKWLACMALLALAAALAACSGGENQSASPAPDAAVPSQAAPESSPAEREADSPAAPEVVTESGEYVGMMDGHTIEIIVNGQATPFQIDTETADKVSTWEEGTPVKFQYQVHTMDNGGQPVKQNVITVIDKA